MRHGKRLFCLSAFMVGLFAELGQAADEKASPLVLKLLLTASQATAAQQAWAKSLGKKVVETNSLGMKLVLIPPGKFGMGSAKGRFPPVENETPSHLVLISQPFYLGVYEVTQSQYARVMGTNPSWFKTGVGEGKLSGAVPARLETSDFPVESVCWNDAQEFCRKLSALNAEQTNGRVYRLPTEAEWEYACRAGTNETRFHFGSYLNGDIANVDGTYLEGTTTKGANLRRTTSVGSYGANALGLYDMHGNVWEWCEDGYDAYAYSERKGTPEDVVVGFETDPFVKSGSYGNYRVLRGGSWYLHPRYARSASRNWNSPDLRLYDIGFRVVSVGVGVRTP